MDLDDTLEGIRSEFEQIQEAREAILVQRRAIIRKCSECIKSIHRGEDDEVSGLLPEIHEALRKLRARVNEVPALKFKDYETVPEQEYCEAACLAAFTRNTPFPTLESLEISGLPYLLGLADVVGELRRFCLDMIRANDTGGALRAFEMMEYLLEGLFTFDFPNSLTPGLRKKVDTARYLVKNTRADITKAVQSARLEKQLGQVLAGRDAHD